MLKVNICWALFLQRSLYCSTSDQCLIFFSLSVSFILSVSLTVAAFVQTHLHNVREQLGSAHSAVGPHSSHPLYQQSAGDGRLQHHHHWLPWRTDLPLGHDTWAGGTDDSGGDINDLYVILLFPMPTPRYHIINPCSPLLRFVPGPCCLVIQPPSPVCLKPVHAVTNSTSLVHQRVGEYIVACCHTHPSGENWLALRWHNTMTSDGFLTPASHRSYLNSYHDVLFVLQSSLISVANRTRSRLSS